MHAVLVKQRKAARVLDCCKRSLFTRRLGGGGAHGELNFGWERIEPAAVHQEECNAEEMRCQADVPMGPEQTEIDQIGERIFLRIDGMPRDRIGEILNIDENRLETQRRKNLPMERIVQRAQPHAAAIVWMPDRTQPVGDVPKTVVPETEHAISGARVDIGGKSRTEIAVELSI